MAEFWSFSDGPLEYDKVSELQKALLLARAQDQIGDVVLFLEHLPVVTRGRGLQDAALKGQRHMPLPGLAGTNIKYSESERGGDLTYHGPGQLVIYPIVKLKNHDVAGWVRILENWTVKTLAPYLGPVSKTAFVRPGSTGVWVGSNTQNLGSDDDKAKKIASIGIAVKKWISYHGIALNFENDLSPFLKFMPCGFAPDVMTSLALQNPQITRGTQGMMDLQQAFIQSWDKTQGEGTQSRLLKLSLYQAFEQISLKLIQ